MQSLAALTSFLFCLGSFLAWIVNNRFRGAPASPYSPVWMHESAVKAANEQRLQRYE
jgi:hypothetical protein